MANSVYDKARDSFLSANINMVTDDIRVMLVDSALYTPNTSTHQTLSDVPVGARVASSASGLTGKSVTNGIFDANDHVISSVSGAQFEYLIIYKHTGVDVTSPLIAIIDTSVGLPYTPTGGNVTIVWDNTANKIFKL
jgi:hypothetical protein